MICTLCKCEEECRPYGVGESMVCYDCATSPEHIEETKKQFRAQLETFQDRIEACGYTVITIDECNLHTAHRQQFTRVTEWKL